MAYNQNRQYGAPRGPSYAQQQAPPRQNGYGGQYQEQQQQQYTEYDQQQQYYDQGYDRSNGQYSGQQQAMSQSRQPQSPPYDERYADGRQQPNGYGQSRQRQERQYDPRYHQRPEKAQQQSYEQQPRQHGQQRQAPTGQAQQQTRPRPDPSQGGFHSQEARPQELPRPPPISTGRPQTAPHQQKAQIPAKMTMEEWKAKEKARMHAAALSPETLAQDNAFPVFPTYQNRSRPGTAQGTSEGAASPTTDVRNDERLALSQSHSHDDRLEAVQSAPQAISRPNLEHKPQSFDAVAQSLNAMHVSPPPQQRSQLQRQDSNMAPIPIEQRPPRRPLPEQYQQYPTNDHQDARSNRQPPARAPQIQPIDTQQIQQSQRLAYMDHQPLSPAVVPPRPSSAQGGRAVISPTSAYSQSTLLDQFPVPVPPMQRGYTDTGASGNANGTYGDQRVAPPVTAAPMNRAQQIESEMPDFDSAAPGGTSLLHKRSQRANNAPEPSPVVAELPSPPLSAPQQQVWAQQPPPNQAQRFYGHSPDERSMSLPTQSRPKLEHAGITDGVVFEVPGEGSHQHHYDNSYLAENIPNQPPQAQSFQPPYAREPPRRSMDDARQMPYRQGPPHPQRFPPNGHSSRGQHSSQQRPPAERNMSSQSAPPRQPMHGQPGMNPNGAPLAKQSSGPQQHDQRQRLSNPDALPHHPPPVRPGLMDSGAGQPGPAKPPPVRNYGNGPPSTHQRQASIEQASKPVTAAELDKLRVNVSMNPTNYKQALLLAKKTIEAGTVLASEGGRADARQTAKNREKYITEGHKMVKKLVAAGSPDAMFYLADCYGSGDLGLEVDPREAFKLYQAAAKAGHGEAAYRTAMCCEMGAEDGGGTSKDYAKAVQWYRRAAALGDPSGMFKVGVISLKGLLGQPRNVGEAVNWLKRSIDSGQKENPHALYELGLMYESSNTAQDVRNKVVPDDAYALELFQRAAAAGHKFSQFRLGQAYEYGQLGLPIDNRTSISWYSKAAAQGEHQAELALSGWYLTGAEGILEHSDMEAYLWARKAASSEPPLAKAMFAMGYFTETGIGCPASIEEAKKWYGRAASYNFPKARERLEELRRNGGRSSKQPVNGRLTRNQKKDESECAIM